MTPTASMVFLSLALAAPAFADAPAVRFHCSFSDINSDTGETHTLTLDRDVTPCGGADGGICLVPIDHLKTPVNCRDFTASFALDDTPPTLDVTLWSYCGASQHAAHPVSQTASFPVDSKHFQMSAEWDGYISDIVCDRL